MARTKSIRIPKKRSLHLYLTGADDEEQAFGSEFQCESPVDADANDRSMCHKGEPRISDSISENPTKQHRPTGRLWRANDEEQAFGSGSQCERLVDVDANVNDRATSHKDVPTVSNSTTESPAKQHRPTGRLCRAEDEEQAFGSCSQDESPVDTNINNKSTSHKDESIIKDHTSETSTEQHQPTGRRWPFSRFENNFFAHHIEASPEETETLKTQGWVPINSKLGREMERKRLANESNTREADENNQDEDEEDGDGEEDEEEEEALDPEMRRACDRCLLKQVRCDRVKGQLKCRKCQEKGAVCRFGMRGTPKRAPSR